MKTPWGRTLPLATPKQPALVRKLINRLFKRTKYDNLIDNTALDIKTEKDVLLCEDALDAYGTSSKRRAVQYSSTDQSITVQLHRLPPTSWDEEEDNVEDTSLENIDLRSRGAAQGSVQQIRSQETQLDDAHSRNSDNNNNNNNNSQRNSLETSPGSRRRSLQPHVVLQRTKELLTPSEGAYQQLDEEYDDVPRQCEDEIQPDEDPRIQKKKRKKAKRKRRKKRIKKVTWRTMKGTWKYFRNGMIMFSAAPIAALSPTGTAMRGAYGYGSRPRTR